MSCPIGAIFVPQGAELKAVQRGLNRSSATHVTVYPIPMGPQPVRTYLEQWRKQSLVTLGDSPSILLLGLCGGLTPELTVGDWVLYRSCIDAQSQVSVPSLSCDAALLKTLQDCLEKSVTVVTGLMCDRMIHRAAEKQNLAQQFGAAVVDMEGYAFLEALQSTGVPVSMMRVVSDDAEHNVPDLAAAITPDGKLNGAKLAMSMVREPSNAFRLIQGSLRGLKQLELATAQLFS